MKAIETTSQEFLSAMSSTKNLSENTILAYSSDLRDFGKFFDDLNLNNERILNYIKSLTTNRKLKYNTVCRKVIVIKMYLQYLTDNGYIEENTLKNLNIKIKRERKLPRTLTTKEIERLLCALSHHV